MTPEQEYEQAENEFIQAMYDLSDPLKIGGGDQMEHVADIVVGVLVEAIMSEKADK